MSFDASTVALLRKLLAEKLDQSVGLVTGGRCADFSEYRYSVGYIQALNDVNTMIEQIQADLQKG